MAHTEFPVNDLFLTPELGMGERLDREGKLRLEIELWKAVNDSLPDLIVQVDSRGKLVYFNRWLDRGMLGKYLPDLAEDPDDRRRLSMLLSMLLGEGESGSEFEYSDPQVTAMVSNADGVIAFEYCHPSGAVYECRAAAVFHRKKIVGAAIAVRDVTDQRALQRDLQAVTAQLMQAQKLSAIGQLAAGMAHEINTPVQFVSDNLNFLEKSFSKLAGVLDVALRVAGSDPQVATAMANARVPRLREQIPRALAQSRDGLARVGRLVAAMKEFSHPSSGTKEPVRILELFESTATVARNEWRYVADLEYDVPEVGLQVPLLRDEFGQVLLNLIVNSAHAIGERFPSGDRSGRIRLSARRCESGVEIRVSDNGAGIPEEIRERVFDPFFTTKPVGKGTGQGLAIAWSVVVDKHRGTLQLESEIGVGTTFVIRLPTET